MLFQLNNSDTVPVRTKESIRVGDTIRISISEKERTQTIQGVVLTYHKLSRIVKVRRIFQEIGFDRIISLYSPLIQSIKILKRNNLLNKRSISL